jgi:hypothetical protein
MGNPYLRPTSNTSKMGPCPYSFESVSDIVQGGNIPYGPRLRQGLLGLRILSTTRVIYLDRILVIPGLGS